MTEIAVFARAPEPGACKTRLIPALGAPGAARLHAALVARALASATACGLGAATLWCAPNADHPFFAACARAYGVGLRAQPGGDLGAKMLAAFEAAAGPLLLMGSDCPGIGPKDLRACAGALDEVDAVFLPAEDGGYGLVGARRPHPAIFRDVDWGSDRVMGQTRDALRRARLTWREPRVIWDVDWPDDLDRLRREAPHLLADALALPKGGREDYTDVAGFAASPSNNCAATAAPQAGKSKDRT